MQIIRFQRTGRKNVAAYRLVVAEKSKAVKGKVGEYLGYYLPTRKPHVLEINKERIEYWIGQGAQVSDTAARLLSKEGIAGLEKYIEKYTKKKKKKQPEGGEQATPAAPATDASTAEQPEAEKEEVKKTKQDEKSAEKPKEEDKKEEVKEDAPEKEEEKAEPALSSTKGDNEEKKE